MIENIKIMGFKSIKLMELDLKPINILIGSNGSGKSNFLLFFKLLSAIFNTRLPSFVAEENADNLLYFGRKKTFEIHSEIIFKDIELRNVGYYFRLSQNNEGGLILDWESSGYAINNKRRRDGAWNNFNFHQFDSIDGSKLKTEDENIIIPDTYQTNKNIKKNIESIKIFHFHDTTSTSFLRSECNLNDNLYFKPDGRNLPAMLYLIKFKHPKIYSRILKTIQSIAPYIESFILEPNKLKEETIALRWIDKGDLESNFSAYQLSDGTLRFIALATLLMQPEPPAVIIIDEPELGLHPFAIGKLAGMIQTASSESQIIIATQSPSLISHFKPEDVIVVDKSESENQSIFKRLDSESLDIWLEEYSLGDLWERNIINAAQPFEK